MNDISTQEATAFPQPPPRLSVQRNFGWSFSANVIYAASQWGMLVALAKLGSPLVVGQFVLGLAVTAPVMLLCGLQLRQAQASDAGKLFSFAQYLTLRGISTVFGLVAIVAIAAAGSYKGADLAVILAIAGAKAIEAFNDQFYGLFQQHERMDYVGKSLMRRGPLGLAALAVLLYLTRSVFWGAVGIAAANAIVLLAHDMPESRRLIRTHGIRSGIEVVAGCCRAPGRMWRLALDTLPLGLVSMLISLNPNVPRYIVEHYLGARSLGIFGAIAYLHTVGNTVIMALCGSAIPRLSVLRDSGQHAAFRSLLLKVVGVSAGVGACAVLATLICGRLFLAIVYGPEYAAHADVFLLQMIASGLIFVAATMMAGLTAARRFAIQLPLWGITVGVTLCFCLLLIPGYGLIGTGVAMVASAAIQLTITAITMGFVLKRESRGEAASVPAVQEFAN